MLDVNAYALAGAALAAVAIGGWLISVVKNDVSIVDVLWGPMFLVLLLVYSAQVDSLGPRAALVLTLVAVWAIRLSVHIAWRNHGQPEDRRYRQIRFNHEPHFAIKSVYIVFGLQAALAWIIGVQLAAAVTSQAALGALEYAGVALWLIGFAFETIGDLQLARFKRDPANSRRVLDRGLWAHTRHPNYFGEFVLWWGYFLIALGGGAWWSVFAPLLMTELLLKVSGVALLERDIGRRRPEYDDYIRSTNAFFPGPGKNQTRPSARVQSHDSAPVIPRTQR